MPSRRPSSPLAPERAIEKQYGLPVVVGTHPIPLKYLQTHNQLPFWEQVNMKDIAGHLLAEHREVMESYN